TGSDTKKPYKNILTGINKEEGAILCLEQIVTTDFAKKRCFLTALALQERPGMASMILEHVP
ncbi:MAG TPA: hypothetical protein VMU21_03815, partial [Thermodesulfovibrionales bacterium]|nr:hypothetical protein [Thermodesulfovibrionales bacterium]